MKQQLEESGRNAEAVQTEWYLAEQHLISVANVRDQQTVQQENLRDGNQRSLKKNPSQKSIPKIPPRINPAEYRVHPAATGSGMASQKVPSGL